MMCSCDTLLEALGQVSCYTPLSPVRRIIFITDINQQFSSNFDFTTSSLTRDYFTDTLYNVESDRAEPVVEELDNVKFFVRDNVRTFAALLASPSPTLGYYLEKIRCLSRAGVILIDANCNAWGAVDSVTSYQQVVRAIPIVPASLAVKMQFPTSNAISKYVLSFDFDVNFKDYQMKIINTNCNYLTHQARVPAYIRCLYDSTGNILTVEVYTSYQTITNNLITIVNNVSANDIIVRDSANNIVSLSFTQTAPGTFVASTSSLSAGNYSVEIDYSNNNLYRFDLPCRFTI